MSVRKALPVWLLAALTVLAACAPAAVAPAAMPDKMAAGTPEAMMDDKTGTTTPDAMMDDKMGTATPDAMMDDTMATGTPESMMDDKMGTATPDAMMDDKGGMMDAPAWFGAALTDVHTGETFMLGDFKGKVVLVETMAQWCPKCLEQQRQVQALREQLGARDDLVVLGLDVDPNEDAATLKTYIEGHGFDWLYAVAPAEVAREMAQLYGDQFLNPSSTPMLIIDRDGEVHALPFGIKSAADLMQALEPFLKGAM